MSHQGNISANGRFVAFVSFSSNLVEFPDTNQAPDVFVRDVIGGSVHLASLGANMQGANAQSQNPVVSADGRWVAFESPATNLIASGDTNGQTDVFLRDSACWFTQIVSVSSDQVQGNGMSMNPAISADGRFVSFFTFSTNLVPDPLAFNENILTRDTWMMATALSSKNTAGLAGDYISRGASISGDGRFVAYESFAANLVPMDTNSISDIFVTDTTATTSPADQFQLVRGTLVSGNLLSLSASDDNRLVLRPGVTFSSMQAPIEVYFIGTVGVNIAELEVLLETSATSANISQQIEIFNFQTCVFEDLGTTGLTPQDAFQGGQPVGEMSPYISSGQVWIRASYRQTGPVFLYPWSVRIDQVRFVTSN
jgi:hypothetical protein